MTPYQPFLRSLVAASTCALAVACSSDDPEGGSPPPAELPAPTLPAATGTCPAFVEGRAEFTVNGAPRTVQLYVDPTAAAAADGPVVLYWYGTLGTPEQAVQALGEAGIAQIKSQGGVVVAPVHENTGTFPWINGDLVSDYALADEVIACAEKSIGIDERRIHSTGFSAGGLFTAQLSWARSNYLASVATFSGGASGDAADPANPFAAMVLYGGPNDQLVLKFEDTSKAYRDELVTEGHFAFLCNHGGGHSIPPGAGPSVVQFFLDHPYKVSPEPYASALPQGFPAYCTL
jgi:predicted esterase